MTGEYPQMTEGSTLFDHEQGGERRRVFARMMGDVLEVGEATAGSLTAEVYGAPEHHHCIHLSEEACARSDVKLQSFFAEGAFLADLMDVLDSWSIPYGYLNSVMGQFVCYRPAQVIQSP